jgi:D-3-phosphoglycerate dehydrogenase
MRIVIVESDHDGFEPEKELARERGIDLEIALSAAIEELVENARGADGILMQYAELTPDVLDRLEGVRAIGRYGVGVDTIDVEAATARGIAVCNVPDYGSEAVSDHAIALALAGARGIARLDRGLRAGVFGIEGAKPLYELSGRSFGVLGAGRIGRATARKARGVGFRTIGYDPLLEPGTEVDGIRMTTLDAVLAESDILSLHLPLTTATRHLIDAEALARMKPGALLVNTSRGGTVDTAALVEALTAGRLGGAALDVFESEPLPPDNPLLALESVTLTPHAAWYTEESYQRLKRGTLENVIDVCAGARPRVILNPAVLDS